MDAILRIDGVDFEATLTLSQYEVIISSLEQDDEDALHLLDDFLFRSKAYEAAHDAVAAYAEEQRMHAAEARAEMLWEERSCMYC